MDFENWTDQEIVEELCDIEEGLTNWEMDFVDSLARRVNYPGLKAGACKSSS